MTTSQSPSAFGATSIAASAPRVADLFRRLPARAAVGGVVPPLHDDVRALGLPADPHLDRPTTGPLPGASQHHRVGLESAGHDDSPALVVHVGAGPQLSEHVERVEAQPLVTARALESLLHE